jgi:hypothetical protein
MLLHRSRDTSAVRASLGCGTTCGMNKKLKEMIDYVETWPEEDQEELAQYARDIQARRSGAYTMTTDEREAVQEGLEQARSGEFVADEDMKEFWKRHGIA